MAIKRIRELPDELPHARLYLDDIEEISKLLLEAYTSALTALNTKFQAKYQLPANRNIVSDEAVKIVYRVGDSQMDSIDDLHEHGRYATNFGLIVLDSTSHAELHVHSFHVKPKLRLGYPRRCRRSGHKKIRNHSTPWLLGRKAEAVAALIAVLKAHKLSGKDEKNRSRLSER